MIRSEGGVGAAGGPAESEAIRRARILGSMRELVAEQTFHRVSASDLCRASSVSAPTFRSLFESTRGCFTVLVEQDTEHVCTVARHGARHRRTGRAALRGALTSLLVCLDREPALARVWLLEAPAAGGWAMRTREETLARQLRRTRLPADPSSPDGGVLQAQLAMQGVLGVLGSRTLSEDPAPHLSLLGPLCGAILRPYASREELQEEVRAAERLARLIRDGRRVWPLPPRPWDLSAVPARLLNPAAHKARGCLRFLADHQGASNRQVATAVGVAHQSQISLLLADLERDGLVLKVKGASGRPNAWSLTLAGAEAATALAMSIS